MPSSKAKRRRQSAQDKPQTPPALDAAVKRIFAYGPSRKRGNGQRPPATDS